MMSLNSLRNLPAAGIALALVACSSAENTADNMLTNQNDPSVTLNAQVVQWDTRIRITYSLVNNSTDDLVTFDGPIGDSNDYLQSLILESGVVRLFKGKISLNPTVVAVTTPLVGGRLVMPDGTLEGMGSIDLPITAMSLADDSNLETVSPTAVEFCVGFSKLDDVADTVQNESEYPQTENLDVQRLACVRLQQP